MGPPRERTCAGTGAPRLSEAVGVAVTGSSEPRVIFTPAQFACLPPSIFGHTPYVCGRHSPCPATVPTVAGTVYVVNDMQGLEN